MNSNSAPFRTVLLSALTLTLCVSRCPATGAETYTTRTNWADRTITNVIEVRMPRNIFVNEFHTNWHDQVITTVVEVEKTNLITRTVTNTVVVDAHAMELRLLWRGQLLVHGRLPRLRQIRCSAERAP